MAAVVVAITVQELVSSMLNAAAIVLAVVAGRVTAALACHRSVPTTDGSTLGVRFPGIQPIPVVLV